MAESKKTIYINPKRHSLASVAVRQALYWGFLVGSIGLSHQWFGGSWVIDIVAFLMAILAFVFLVRQAADLDVRATVADMQAWARQGAPDDIAKWLKDNRHV